MKQIISVLLVCIITHSVAFGQKKMIINYYFKDSTEANHNFYFPLVQPISQNPMSMREKYAVKQIIADSQDGFNQIKCTFLVADTTISIIGDGFGHEIFTIPGDEINIYFSKIPKTNGRRLLNNQFVSPYFSSFTYQGKNKYFYSLFDSLAYHTGGLLMHGTISLKQANNKLSVFFDTVTYRYRQRLDYLKKYSTQYHLPVTLQKLAFNEVKAAYINNLLIPLSQKGTEFDFKDFPKAYLDSLNSINFDDPQYFKSPAFNGVALGYEMSYHDRTSLKVTDIDNDFKRTYNSINKHYTTASIKERLLADFFCSIFGNINNQNCKSCDSLFSDFAERFPSSTYQKYIDSCYKELKKEPTATLKDMLATAIVDYNGSKFTIADILKNKPVIIDCWASWCVPCLKELPYSAELKKKYDGKADVIYLSFDRDKNSWLNKVKALSLTQNSYLVDGGFKSSFANYFHAVTIPRYIIFDNKGEVANKNAPRPSTKEMLGKIVDNLITTAK